MKQILTQGMVLTLAVTTILHAQTPEFQDKPVERYLSSREVADMKYRLMITLPPGYEHDQRSYPVLYYLDAWMLGGVMHDAHRIANLLQAVEPVILVGLSLDGGPSDFFYTRARDYTPTRVPPEKLGPAAAAWVPTSGGGPQFLKFLKGELVPFIEKHYRADPTDRGILGYSLGGLFAAWALQTDPTLFKRYGICSPSLNWDDAKVVRLWENLPDLSKGTVILFSQTEGEDMEIKAAIDTLISAARSKPGVRITRFEVAGEGHHTGVVATHMRALLLLYEKPKP